MIARRRQIVRMLGFATAVALSGAWASAAVKLNALFTDHMVLQRDHADPIFGTATPGAELTITLTAADGSTRTAKGKADESGKFNIALAKPEVAKNPYTIRVVGDGADVTLHDVLAGDVWVCSGQSNMAFAVRQANNHDAEIAGANFPNIRLFTVPNVPQANPVDDTGAQPWAAATPQTVPNFSAVAYFFGRRLNQDLNIPIGLIHTSWGGTPAEAWTPTDRLEALAAQGDTPEIAHMMERRRAAASPEGRQQIAAAANKFNRDYHGWLERTGRADPGPKPETADWSKPDFDDSSWKTMSVPGDWVAQGEPNGCAWYRRTVDIPADKAGQPLTIYLGSIDDADTTWFNGQQVGQTAHLPQSYQIQRAYKVPGNLVKAGRNTIAIRVWDTDGGAGLTGPAATMNVGLSDGKIPLAGEWKWKRESTIHPTSNDPAPRQPAGAMQLDHPNAPSSLYNGMVHPLGQFGLKGAIWYQGETNAPRYQEYERLLTTMIDSWRDQFGQGDFPFYIVGLANFQAPTDDPNAAADWAGLREAQRMTAAHVKHSGMSVTIDIGETNDIHPKDKQDVGERLARIALHDTYGRDIVSRGPTLDHADFENGKVVLHFENIGGGLKAKDGQLKSFAIAGDDGRFAWADAKIEGDTVVLTAPGIAKPTQAKYAFANNPTASLFNAEGLPAEPFIVTK